jgi:diadenylate cyclase
MKDVLPQISGWAILDICLIAFLIYHLLILIRGTRAAQVFTGIIIMIGTFFVLSQLYPLTTFKWMMNKFYSSFIMIIVILFQEDIRNVLSKMGKKPIFKGAEAFSSRQILDEIVRAASSLASDKIGALIVMERNILLNRYVDRGVTLDAQVSKELLVSVFNTSSPIHDGAVIVQEGRCAAAGCFLPLTRDENVDARFGTRNRAAIGITQETDAVVVLVSEEEGSVSLVIDGVAHRNLSADTMRERLWKIFGGNTVIGSASGAMPNVFKPDILRRVVGKLPFIGRKS